MAEAYDKDGIVGPMFRAARVGAGLSLREMADRLGVTHVMLGMMERGLLSPPKHQYRAYFRVLGEEAAAPRHGKDRK